ncbi:multi-component transcriptional regulator, winged helix family protein [Scytonema sp. HK-05]|uniref:response regulator n=1 Tax=Scytonema sp. HK-05 TaxID=1137095 RepID=UPI0009370E6C|nr:response regulator [Scytonema sp. HK-05]OKH56169.1 multi-component transcriptional regulator [Scytonema sp. HK-05]BAY49384.1 multi-component transcriptional regulator, winged helix family protein [Scytonema sp. HK-05]
MKILLVEDDRPTAAVLYEVLTVQYYTVELATDGENGLALATSCNFDLILLDLLIPKLDGISLCRQLRAQGVQTPILLLTAKDQSADVVKGLDAGADDYLTKPYELCELLARMRALLRRGQTELVPAVLTWENLCVNPVSAEVTYKGQLISLTPKEYSLLGLFLRNPQRVFSRSDIIDRLWSIDAIPSEGTVTNLIKDLRQKLKAQGMFADLLETVYGLGYRLKTPPKSEGAKGVLSGEQGEQTHRLGEAGKGKRQMGLASVNKVIERYKDTFAQRVILLEQVELALRFGKLQPELRQRASNEAHKLAGTLGSFGYETGSKLAQAIEHLLMDDKPLAPTQAPQLSKLVTELKEALSKPPTPLTIEELEPTNIPLVLVIDDESLTNQLKTEATNWGVRIEMVASWAIAQKQISQSPNAVLLNLNKQDPLENSLKKLQKLKEQLPTTPILVMAEQDNLTERVAVSRLGAHRFLHKPVAAAEVFEAIAQVLPQFQAPQAKVMILDDDPVALELLSNLLQPWGFRVKTLQDPQQFWEVLTTTTPDLLLIDLEMPTYSGIDLCRVVRQDPKWGNLPILVVTAYTDLESIQQVFAAGADDFIGKPVVGPELVTRVISRIDRSRLQQELKTLKRRIGN